MLIGSSGIERVNSDILVLNLVDHDLVCHIYYVLITVKVFAYLSHLVL